MDTCIRRVMTATPLDPNRHGRMRVGSFPDFAHASRQQHAILGWSEIALAAADYPLALMKHSDTGQFNVVALYGFSAAQNLSIAGSHWHATYIPQNSLRYPFFVSEAGTLGLAIDERSELIGVHDGHRLFDDDGRPTSYTVQIADALRELRRDFEDMQEFVLALVRLQLLRPLRLVMHMEDGSASEIEGLYSISDQAQASLADNAILALHRKGYLQALSILMASLVQMNRLQQLHNAQSPHKIRDVALVLND